MTRLVYASTYTIFASIDAISILLAKLLSVKATLLKRGASPHRSFLISRHNFPHFLKVWHYHTELELVYIRRSEGTRFIGDNIQRFRAGELVLIGSNLPHMYQNDEPYFEPGSTLQAEAHVVHFSPLFLQAPLTQIPELRTIHLLIEKARLGIQFTQETTLKIASAIMALEQLSDLQRMLSFLNILATLAEDHQAATLATPGFVNHFDQAGDTKLDKVYDHVMQHFQQDISVDDIADLVSMNKSSFCRYFKRTTQKTFTEFLNEVRIGFACKVLTEKQMGILETSYHCGYNNISHFNRQFKKKMKMSPSGYLRSRKTGVEEPA